MLNKIWVRICFVLTHKISDIIDGIFDKRACGRYLPIEISKSTEEIHSNAPTPYLMLKKIFDYVKITSNDSFLDVGCGNGRVLAFLKQKTNCNQITGIEINQQSFCFCKQRTSSHSNIKCLNENILDLPLNGYTVLYLYNPFGEKTLKRLKEKIENEVSHSLILIYASDNEYGNIFYQKSCWELQKKFFCYRYGIIFYAQYPQRVSIWKYAPSKSYPQKFDAKSPLGVKNEDCKLSQSYYEKFKGIRKYDEMHAFYDNGSCDTNVIDKQTYNELYKSGQIEPSWDELNF